MKNYIGISRDHSRSMWNISGPAAKDYNANIAAMQTAATTNNLDTIVSVVKCGVGSQARVDREIVNSNVHVLRAIPDDSYIADGSGTPLWDSVGELIDILSAVPDASDPEVSFLVMVITDGQENCSRKWSSQRLSGKIGCAFYQLTKTENVQEVKQICLCDRQTGAIYTGTSARDLLGLPHHGAITLAPHNLGQYDVFVQSTSVNRKLVGGTTVLYSSSFIR